MNAKFGTVARSDWAITIKTMTILATTIWAYHNYIDRLGIALPDGGLALTVVLRRSSYGINSYGLV